AVMRQQCCTAFGIDLQCPTGGSGGALSRAIVGGRPDAAKTEHDVLTGQAIGKCRLQPFTIVADDAHPVQFQTALRESVDHGRHVLITAFARQQLSADEDHADARRVRAVLGSVPATARLMARCGHGVSAPGRQRRAKRRASCASVYDQPATCFATAASSMGLSSPAWNRSMMMSEPPTSSPLT